MTNRRVLSGDMVALSRTHYVVEANVFDAAFERMTGTVSIDEVGLVIAQNTVGVLGVIYATALVVWSSGALGWIRMGHLRLP